MAKLIEFRVPDKFRAPSLRIPADERGRVIVFRPRPVSQSATNAGERRCPLSAQAGSAPEVPFRWP